jgi:hypothetical protein
MDSHSEIIDHLGGGTAVAEGLAAAGHEADREMVYKWHKRDRIPQEWWSPLVELARTKKKRGVTLERLSALSSRRLANA